MAELPTLLDPAMLAEKLSMPVSSIYRLVRETDIPRYRFGRLIRFDQTEVLEWIRTHTQEGDHDQ